MLPLLNSNSATDIALARFLPSTSEIAVIAGKWEDRFAIAFIAVMIPVIALFIRQSIKAWSSPSSTEEKPIKLRFQNHEPFVVRTPTETVGMAGHVPVPGPTRVYVRVFPECETPVPNCTPYLLAIYREDNGRFLPTELNEPCLLTWAYRPLAGSLTVEPLIGPYVDVFYIEKGNDQLIPCIPDAVRPLRIQGRFHRLNTYRFDVQVTNGDPVALRVRPGTDPAHPIQVELIEPYSLPSPRSPQNLMHEPAEPERWQRLNSAQRQQIANALRPLPRSESRMFDVSIQTIAPSDCRDLAADLRDAINQSGLNAAIVDEIGRPITHQGIIAEGGRSDPIFQRLIEALNAAGLRPLVTNLDHDRHLALRIGRRVS